MKKLVEKGKTLLISGPTAVILIDGKATILGSNLIPNKKIVIRKGKILPFEIEENSVFNIILSEISTIKEVVGSTIPNSWRKTTKEILSQPKPYTVLTIGGVDCGKTTFCTFLANHSLRLGYRTVIIDADLGQTDIGPPTTIGFSFVQDPVYDLFYLKAQNIFFTGITNPSTVTDRIIEGLYLFKQQAEKNKTQVTIINTDGWTQGEGAKEFKIALVKVLLPQATIGIQQGNELEHIFKPAEDDGFKIYRLNYSPAVRIKDRETRKELREQSYKKFLRKNVLRNLPMKWIQLEYTPLSNGASLNIDKLIELEEIIGRRVVYCEETSNELFIVLEEDQIGHEVSVKLKEFLKKRFYIVNNGDERGLLVGLLDQHHQFLGLGVISKIEYKQQNLKIFTSCKEKISIVQFGQMKINKNGKELGVIKSFSK